MDCFEVSHYGFVDFIDEPTVLYRQHGNNVIGAKRTNIKYYYFRLAQLPGVMRDNIKLKPNDKFSRFQNKSFKRLLLKMKIVTKNYFLYESKQYVFQLLMASYSLMNRSRVF